MAKIPCKIAKHKDPNAQDTVNIKTGIFNSRWQKFKGYMSSTDRYLEDVDPKFFKPLINQMREAHFGDNGEQYFRYKLMDEYSNATSGFKGNIEDISDALDGKSVKDVNAIRIAQKIRPLYDKIHAEAVKRGVTAGGEEITKISDYFPHMEKADSLGSITKDAFKSLFNKKITLKDRLNSSKEVPIDPTGSQGGAKQYPGDITYGNLQNKRQGAGDPAHPELIERNPHIAYKRYLDASSRVMFREPVYRAWDEALKKYPESFDKEQARYLIDHYAGVSGDSDLGKLDKWLGKIASRSVLSFSAHLQVYHAMRVVAMGIPEIGVKHTIKGFTQYVKDIPSGKNQSELIKAGLVDPTQKIFKTGMENFDNFANYGDIGNNFAKSIMLKANQSRLKAAKDPNWKQNAIYATAQQEGMVNPTSPIRFVQKVPRVIMQFKYFVAKYGENVARAAFNKDKTLVQNMQKLGKFAATGYALHVIGDKIGIPLYHVSAKQLNVLSSVAYDSGKEIIGDLEKGDVGKALVAMARTASPTGRSVIQKDGKGGFNLQPPTIFDKPKKQVDDSEETEPKEPKEKLP